MANPPNPNDSSKGPPPDPSGLKRHPTDQFRPGMGPTPLSAPNEATTTTPAYSDDVTTTTPAIGDDVSASRAVVGDDVLGPGPLDSGRSEPSSPANVIGPVTKRRLRTAPYQEPSGELKLPAPVGPDGKPGKKSKKLDADGNPLPKKPLWRRIVKGVVWTIAILILLVGAFIGFLHTGPGKSFAKGIVESALNKKYDGVVTIDKLDYALGGDVEIQGLVIAQHDGRKVVNLHDLVLTLDWGSLLSKPLTIEKLVVAGVDLDLVQFADGTSNLKRMQKEPTKVPDALVIQDVVVSGVNVSIEKPDGSKLKVSDLGLAAAVSFDNAAGTLDLALKSLAGKLDNDKVTADFALAATAKKQGETIAATLTPGAIKVTPKTLAGASDGPIDVVIKPIDVSLKDGFASMTFGGLAAGPLTIAGIKTSGNLPPPGTLGLGPGDHTMELTGVKIDHAGVNKLLGKEVLLSDVNIDATVKGPMEHMTVAGKVATDGGNLGMDGTVDAHDLGKPVVHLVLTGDDIDTTKILAGEKRPDLQTSFKAVIDMVGLPPANTITVHADVYKTVVKGKTIDSVVIDFDGKGDLLTLDGLQITAFGQVVKMDGQFDRGTREFAGNVKMNTILGDAIQKARDAGVSIAPLPPISGTLDVDLGIQGKLKPKPEVTPGVEVAPAAPFDPKALIVNGRIDLSSLPIETLIAKGNITGKDVVIKASPERLGLPDKKVGDIDVDLDMKVEGGKPDGISGQLVAKVGGVDTGKTTLDNGELKVVFDGLKQDITIKADDAKQGLALDVAMQSVLDLVNRHVDTTVSKLDVKRGPAETHLEAPVTLAIDSSPDGKQSVKLPPMKLALAGGTMALALAAQLSKDEANPGANKVDHFDLSLDLDGVDVGRLAALAKKSTRGLSGKLDATVKAQGTKENPQLDFFGSLHGRMHGGAPFTAKFDGAMRDKKLDLALDVTDKAGRKDPLFTLDVMAPLNLPTTPGAKPSLGAGRFSVKAELPETTLSRLAAVFVPQGLPANVDPDANIGFGLDLKGTTTRPTGDWHLDFTGDMLQRRGYDKAPARQKVAVSGHMAPEGAQIAVDNDFDFHLDAGAPAFVQHHLHGTFAKSPLLKGFMDRPWAITAGLAKPLDLGALYDLGLAKKPLQGALTSDADLHGQGADVLGTLGLKLAGVKYGTAPVANIEGLVSIADTQIEITQKVNAAGLDAVAVDAIIGVGGKGLRTAIKDRPRLMQAPVSGAITLVGHAISEWKKALEGTAKLPDLPGNVGGTLALGGTLQTPTAKGAFAWDAFDTAAGTPGRVAFEVDAGTERATGGLAIGPNREVTLMGSVARADLKPPVVATADAVPAPLPIALVMKADHVDLLRLVPAFATAGKPWQVHGTLDWDMSGTAYSSRDPKKPGLAPGSFLTGDMTVSALDIEVPDTDRHIQDGRIAFKATREALEIAGIDLHEARYPHIDNGFVTPPDAADKGDRDVHITGRVPWTDLKIDSASLDIKTHDWLILGQGFDSPEGELDLDMSVAATNLTQPVKTIDVTISGLDLYSPDRFIRAHYPQFPAYDDVVYLDESKKPSGVLPPGKGYVAPPDPNAPVAPAPDPNAGFDVHLSFPNKGHIVFSGNSPIEIKLQGAMDVTVRGKDLNLKGRLDVTDGILGAMGRDFHLVTGAITADGGLDSAKAQMLFAIKPNELALRDIADGWHHDQATITVTATAKTGLVTKFDGVSGPYLLDMATLLNTGRARQWGLPDVPSSETVRFGNEDQGLVNTFIQTNLRNLVFMDRFNGWSESLEEPTEYGRLRFFDMQRFVADGGARVRFIAQPVEIGQNRMELGYDWLLLNNPNTVIGFGPHLGTDLRAGFGLNFDFSSKD